MMKYENVKSLVTTIALLLMIIYFVNEMVGNYKLRKEQKEVLKLEIKLLKLELENEGI